MRILLVEDQSDLAESVSEYLIRNKKINCELASTFYDALDFCQTYEYDCVVVDIGLPDGSGLDLIRELKKMKYKAGIIIVSARNSLDDRVLGLEIGADDYLVKPFHLSELSARIHSLIRRLKVDGDNFIIFNELKLNPQNREVFISGNLITLTKTEYDLLYYFMTNAHQVLSKTSIAEHLVGQYVDVMNSLDFVYLHIKNLRKKLVDNGCKDYIKTVYGVGYKFVSE